MGEPGMRRHHYGVFRGRDFEPRFTRETRREVVAAIEQFYGRSWKLLRRIHRIAKMEIREVVPTPIGGRTCP